MAHIDLQNVSLLYPTYGADAMNLKTTLVNMATGGLIKKETRSVLVEALDNISFTLKKGDRLALIGHNGAGKSSLLRVLAKVYEPSKGNINIQGRSNCLFDLMMGMDMELNGYENIILRGRIAGLSRKQALSLVPAVEEFAELGQFMNMPIKTYSSGMQVRLAFGIITNLFSEILLIDEIINVGDAQFMKKARAQMNTLINQSEILVLSTHDLNIIRELCNKALWLDHGKIKHIGPVEEVISYYQMNKAH